MNKKQLIKDIKGITSVVDFFAFKDRIIDALEDKPEPKPKRED